jgi:Protein of unknown function (DUF3572)
MSKRKPALDLDGAEWVAIHALTFLAGDENRLGRFLSLTGIGPADLARGRSEPQLQAAVLEYLLGDEPLLLEFSANASQPPETIQLAWDLLTFEAARRTRA